MKNLERDILNINLVICKNIENIKCDERGFLSQNILSQLRNFLEAIAVVIYFNDKKDEDSENNYENIQKALRYIKSQNKYKLLHKFHELLQKSASHYTLDENSSERLMLKYYEFLLKIKIFVKKELNMDILENINKFPLNIDKKMEEYYEKISNKIEKYNVNSSKGIYGDRYYIQKIKPFFINENIYYEVTFSLVSDKINKFDRIIAFTKLELSPYYAVKLSIKNDEIRILNRSMPIQIIDNWSVSIRPCELNNFSKIFGVNTKITTNHVEYDLLMKFLTKSKMSLGNFIKENDDYYNKIKEKITLEAKSVFFLNILDKCREIAINKKIGSNVITYLLLKLNNRTIKKQFYVEKNKLLSNLYLQYGCIPFEKMPINSSLIEHNPKISDLIEVIDLEGREYEFLGRFITNNIEKNGILFTNKSDIPFENIDDLIVKYNENIYLPKHEKRLMCLYKNHVYIKGYEEDSVEIIKQLKETSVSGIAGYSRAIESWLQDNGGIVDCLEKQAVLKTMFNDSKVALIYGPAGTGKSTLINHISNFFSENDKLYLANTNPAVDNLRRKINIANCEFQTIAKYLSSFKAKNEYDLLIIDECSTVSNSDMNKILKKSKFQLLILVGDIYQIESILFGNWFSLAEYFMPMHSKIQLEKPYRTSDKKLLDVWNRVRELDHAILEPLLKNNYSISLDESIFDYTDNDQIILCLNYDGLYGINNINRFLQSNNPNPKVSWGINIYKKNDPILFSENNRFAPLIYNNLKGKIIDIVLSKDEIEFKVEIHKAITEIDASNYDFEFIETLPSNHSIIKFKVKRNLNSDDDENISLDTVVPFQIAYAISIHKAQGLEYETVKIVITNEIEEKITHNIFYTAITRTKKNLKIYWTPETEAVILKNLKKKENKKDSIFLNIKHNLTS